MPSQIRKIAEMLNKGIKILDILLFDLLVSKSKSTKMIIDRRKLMIPPRERDKNRAETIIIIKKPIKIVFAHCDSSYAHL